MPAEFEIDNLGIPPLAGVCSYAEAAEPGLSVDGTVDRLKRYGYALRQLHEVATAHLPSTPEWEVKCALSLHLWLDAEHVGASAPDRGDARTASPSRRVPDERPSAAFDEVMRCRRLRRAAGRVYGVARSEILAAFDDHLSQPNPLFDYPTCRLLRTIVREQSDMIEWGRGSLGCALPDDAKRIRPSSPRDTSAATWRARAASAGRASGPTPPAGSLGRRALRDGRRCRAATSVSSTRSTRRRRSTSTTRTSRSLPTSGRRRSCASGCARSTCRR